MWLGTCSLPGPLKWGVYSGLGWLPQGTLEAGSQLSCMGLVPTPTLAASLSTPFGGWSLSGPGLLIRYASAANPGGAIFPGQGEGSNLGYVLVH